MRESKYPRAAAEATPSNQPSHDAAAALNAHLPSPADDKTIEGAFLTLFENVAMHVDNFYVKQPVQVKKETLQSLTAHDTGCLPAPLATLFDRARSGRPLISHVITRVMVNAISPASDPQNTILPVELIGLPRALDHPENKAPTKPGACYP